MTEHGDGYDQERAAVGALFSEEGRRDPHGVLAALDSVAAETGATRNQVVLAWMLGDALSVIPLVGASSVAQLDESLAAVDLELSEEQRRRLDAAGR